MVRVKGGGGRGGEGWLHTCCSRDWASGRHGRSERGGGEGCLHTCCSRDWASGETWSE